MSKAKRKSNAKQFPAPDSPAKTPAPKTPPATPVRPSPKTSLKVSPKQQSKADKRQPLVSTGRARKLRTQQRPPIPWFWIGMVALILIGVGIMIAYRASYTPPALALNVTAKEAYEKYQDGAFLLDVREQDEWDDFHVPGSTWIPLGELASRVSEIPTDQEVIVVCRTGNRSQEGRDILLNAGFEQVTSLTGGLFEWRSQGYPIE